MNDHKFFELNTEGRDFVVGDMHGCFDAFQTKLKEIGFDKEKDRMFSVGDLVDRGDNNLECLSLIKEPWFHSVRGNHEDMMCDGSQWNNWQRNGGVWSQDLLNKEEFNSLIKLASELPIAITVQTSYGTIGICHAEPPSDWEGVTDDAEATLSFHQRQAMIWGRTRLTYNIQTIVEGVSYTIHGHTPLAEPVIMGNALFIDTGMVYDGAKNNDGSSFEGKLTIINISEPINEENFKQIPKK